jgi:Spy/CpxP family protein refolding chaperone
MKKATIVTTLMVSALLLSSMAFAWPGGQTRKNCDGPGQGRGQAMSYEQHEQRMEHHLDFMAIALDLTDDQKQKLEALGEKHWQERQAYREKMQASRMQLREMDQSGEFDEAAYRSKAREHADLKTDMHADKAKMKQDFFAVLTPEQQVKAEKLWEMHDQRRPGQRGGCGECNGSRRHNFGGNPEGSEQPENN